MLPRPKRRWTTMAQMVASNAKAQPRKFALGAVLVFVVFQILSVRSPPSFESKDKTPTVKLPSIPPHASVPYTPSQLAWFEELVGSESTSCETVKKKIHSDEWKDPNDGQIYMRRITSDPPLYVSVHNRGYDGVRFRSIFLKGNYYEKQVRSRFETILSRASASTTSDGTLPVVLDVGGNIGYYTLLSAAWSHAVVTFEINPANLVRLCESLHMNHPSPQGVSPLDHDMLVGLFQKAVSNVHGQALEVTIPRRNPGEATIREIRGSDTDTTTTHSARTMTVTLDQFAADRGWLEKPELVIRILKVDVEGLEPQIIQGAAALLKSGKVRNVLTEFRDLESAASQQAVDLLLDAGFCLVYHQEEGFMRKLTPADSRRYLQALQRDLNSWWNRRVYADLWFQRVDENM